MNFGRNKFENVLALAFHPQYIPLLRLILQRKIYDTIHSQTFSLILSERNSSSSFLTEYSNHLRRSGLMNLLLLRLSWTCLPLQVNDLSFSPAGEVLPNTCPPNAINIMSVQISMGISAGRMIKRIKRGSRCHYFLAMRIVKFGTITPSPPHQSLYADKHCLEKGNIFSHWIFLDVVYKYINYIQYWFAGKIRQLDGELFNKQPTDEGRLSKHK